MDLIGRRKGDAGENWVHDELQRLFTGCRVTNVARSCHSGDIRLDMPVSGQEDIVMLIEVKFHTGSVEKRQVVSFQEHLATQAAYAEAGLFVSLSSTIHGRMDFDLTRTMTGIPREICCISRVKERPCLLEAGVRLMMARVLDQRRCSVALGTSANIERRQEMHVSIQSLTQAIESAENTVVAAVGQLQKARRTAERLRGQIAGQPECEQHELRGLTLHASEVSVPTSVGSSDGRDV